ncbi:MAG: hypothetical protein ABJD11_15560 [Gemmatimonadota bacterium]
MPQLLTGLLTVIVLLLPLGLAMMSATRWSGSWRLGAMGFAAVYAVGEAYAFLAARLYGQGDTTRLLLQFGFGALACWIVIWFIHRIVARA